MGVEVFRNETIGLLNDLYEYQLALEQQLKQDERQANTNQLVWKENDLTPVNPKAKYRRANVLSLERVLRYSFIVMLFLVIENQLVELCRKVQIRRRLPPQTIGLQGRVLELSKTFLARECGPKVFEANWGAIKNISSVRNCVVHALGKVKAIKEKYRPRLREIADSNMGLELGYYIFDEDETVVVSAEYCLHILSETKLFFETLFDATGFAESE